MFLSSSRGKFTVFQHSSVTGASVSVVPDGLQHGFTVQNLYKFLCISCLRKIAVTWILISIYDFELRDTENRLIHY